jgi:acyl dehydratase
MSTLTFETMKDMIGKELGVSPWVEVGQDKINAFADCTGDHQWIHVDVEKAKKFSPFGAPIAHGYLTLSLIGSLAQQVGGIPQGVAAAFNYGLDKVRFLAPVKAGAKVRLRTTLVSFDQKEPGQFLMKTSNVMEIEGSDKPALIAETLAMLIAAPPPKKA